MLQLPSDFLHKLGGDVAIAYLGAGKDPVPDYDDDALVRQRGDFLEGTMVVRIKARRFPMMNFFGPLQHGQRALERGCLRHAMDAIGHAAKEFGLADLLVLQRKAQPVEHIPAELKVSDAVFVVPVRWGSDYRVASEILSELPAVHLMNRNIRA